MSKIFDEIREITAQKVAEKTTSGCTKLSNYYRKN